MRKEVSLFKDFLKFKKLRLTSQRKNILTQFLKMKGQFYIEDLFEKVKKENPRLGITTLYRNMILLVEAGLAAQHKTQRGKRIFERCFGTRHHDHLICVECGKIAEFDHPLIENLQREVAQKNNFFLHSHRMELYGFCRHCKKPAKKNRKPFPPKKEKLPVNF